MTLAVKPPAPAAIPSRESGREADRAQAGDALAGYEASAHPPLSEVANDRVASARPAAEATEPEDREEESRRREYRHLMRKVWTAGLISVPVVLLSYPMLFPVLRSQPWLADGSSGLLWTWRVLGILTLPILVWGGSQFFRGAWAAAKSRSANMNTLIAVGTTAAWIYSTVAVVAPQIFPSAATAPDLLRRGQRGHRAGGVRPGA